MEKKVFIINTFQENDVPASFDQIKIYVVGQDIVIKTVNGDVYEYPFAAQFLSMSKDVFNFKFADGKVISSRDLMSYVGKNDFDIDGSLTTHKTQDNNATKGGGEEQKDGQNGKESKGASDSPDVSPENNEVTVVKVEEVVVEKTSPGASSSVDESLEPSVSDFTNVAAYAVEGKPERPMVISSSSASPKPKTELTELISNVTKTFKTSTLQMGDDINNVTHHIRVGGSRTDGSYEGQYGRKTLDLSSSVDDWTVNGELNGWSYSEGLVLRIVSVNNVDTLTGVGFRSAMTTEYRLILAGTPEGEALGLKANEFAVVYPAKNGAFSVDINFNYEVDDAGAAVAPGKTAGVLNFTQLENPSSIVNDDGTINLGYTPNSLVLKLGSGNDIVIAGIGNDIYDGGSGNNSLDYSHAKDKIIVDLTKDVNADFKVVGVACDDAGIVTLGDKTQYINNFQTITGSNFNDSFTLNDRGHIVYGGKGDDTFIMNGGNNTLQGGEGNNILDYSRIEGSQTYNELQLFGRENTLDINGVTIDFNQGRTTNNGWLDNNQRAGQDIFTDINEVYGSDGNDHIILGSVNTVVTEKVGDNYIEVNGGSHSINGGSGSTILDYTQVATQIEVNLNTGVVGKSELGNDTVSNIYHVIGSSGGTAFTGQSGGHNTLVGLDGKNSFVIDYGYNKVYGGKGTNTYTLMEGNSTIFAAGKENSATVINSILIFNGSSGQQGEDSDYINTLDFSGGTTIFNSGEGKSTNNIISHNGGAITFHSNGTSNFLAQNAGDNNIFIDSGSLLFNALNGGNNLLKAAGETNVTLMGGQASHTITLADTALLALDYSKNMGDGHNVTVDLDQNRNVSIDNESYIDTLMGDGRVYHISGLKTGDTDITLSQSLQENLSITLFHENNRVVFGKGLVDISVDKASESNVFDYSKVNERLIFDLVSGELTRQDVNSTQYLSTEKLINTAYIVGNNVDGNIYKASEQYNVTFETGAGKGNSIIEVEGDHTYYTQGYNIKYDATELKEGIIFEYTGGAGTVKKGNTTTSLQGGDENDQNSKSHITEILGTNHDDILIINVDNENHNQDVLTVINRGGENLVQMKSYGLYNINVGNGVGDKPIGAYNTLHLDFRSSSGLGDVILFGETGQMGGVFLAKEDRFIGSSLNNNDLLYTNDFKLAFDYIDIINYTARNALFADWGTSAQGVNITVNNGDKITHLIVNGGGNTIDAGYSYASNLVNKTSFVSYKNNSSGIDFDMSTGCVNFADGRVTDNVSNFNRFEGSRFNDHISMTSEVELTSSDGYDTIVGNGATYRLSDEHTKTNANFYWNTATIGKFDSKSNHHGTDTITDNGVVKFINGKNAIYADIYTSDRNDMEFELVKGDVNFYSNKGANNYIDTGNSRLTLNYGDFSEAITLNMSNGTNSYVGKNNNTTADKFTFTNVINGTHHGDTFNLTGVVNNGKTLNLNAASGIDTFTFNGSTTKINISGQNNKDTTQSENYYFNGANENLNIDTKNTNNYFEFKDTVFTSSAIKTVGNNKFLFQDVNSANNGNASNITINNGSESHLYFSGNVNKINLLINQGANNISFKNGSSVSNISVTAGSGTSHNRLDVDSFSGVDYTSHNGGDVINLNNASNIKGTFDLSNNTTTGALHNTVSVSGSGSSLNFGGGVRDDVYDFSQSVNYNNVNISDKGGDNTFLLSGQITNSQIKSTGDGHNVFVFYDINKGLISHEGLTVNVSSGENIFTLDGVNKYIDIYGGSGVDKFILSGDHSGVYINAGLGDDRIEIVEIGSGLGSLRGGGGIDSIVYTGKEMGEVDFLNDFLLKTDSIESFDFGKLTVDIDFSKFTTNYSNNNAPGDQGVIDITVGSKNNINIINDGSAYGWHHVEGADVYTNLVLGTTVNIHYDQPPAAA